MNWPCARIFFFEKDKSNLILGAIAPVIEEWSAQAGAAPVWLRSHWRLGPHIDVIAEMSEAEFDHELMPLIEQRVGAWLAQNPSSVALDADQYGELSNQLAIAELESAPLAPLHKNNTIVRASHEPNLEIFGVREILEGQHRFHALSLPAVFDALKLREKDANAIYMRLAEMLALIGNFVPRYGLPRSFISFRAHADYVFANYDNGGVLKQRFDAMDAAFKSHTDRAVEAAHQVYLGKAKIADAFPHLASWYEGSLALSHELYDVAERNAELLGQQNRLIGLADEVVASTNVELDPARARKDSETEQYIGDMPTVFKQVPHIAYRTMVNYFYSLLPLMSVAPIQKYAICHLISNSCERVFEKSWKTVVDEGRIREEAVT